MARFARIISAIDAHTAGEPARIVLSGLPPIRGETMAAKKQYMQEHLDGIRALLMREPRGHRDLFGVILTPSTTAWGQYGVLFIDNAGYIDMCGHGIMSAATALIETGTIPAIGPDTTITFDTPAGTVRAHARVEGGRVVEVSVANVPSFLHARNVTIDLPGVGQVLVDVAFGGNFFVLARAHDLGVAVHPDHYARLIELGLAIRRAANAALEVGHPSEPHLNTINLTEISEELDPAQCLARSVVIFGAGQLDRCPCGTGTSAAMAARYARGELALGEEFTSEGILGTRFRGRLVREVQVGDKRAVEPVVTGSAYLTGIQQFVVDPDDPFQEGFTLP